jgi:hypothetical protein
MRSAFLLSVVSFALLGLLGWVRHETNRPTTSEYRSASVDEEAELFVG